MKSGCAAMDRITVATAAKPATCRHNTDQRLAIENLDVCGKQKGLPSQIGVGRSADVDAGALARAFSVSFHHKGHREHRGNLKEGQAASQNEPEHLEPIKRMLQIRRINRERN
jgi:RIO-like serine/threonine protein kinase